MYREILHGFYFIATAMVGYLTNLYCSLHITFLSVSVFLWLAIYNNYIVYCSVILAGMELL